MRKAGIILFAASLVFFQAYLAGRLSVLGVIPDLAAVFVVFWALRAPKADAFRFAFLVGIGLDLLGPAPLGFMAASMGLVCLAAASMGKWMNGDSWAVRTMIIFASCLAVRTASLWELSACGAEWGFREWMIEAVLASACTSAFGIPVCHAALHIPFFRAIRPAGGLTSDV